MTLHLVPVTQKTANDFVAAWHRHNRPVQIAICSVGVADDAGTLRGVAIVGRPSARKLCDGWTAEVLRTCTDGAANANSMLYGAAWRAVRALGYRRLVTYTQHSETGASLRAAGWKQTASLPTRQGWDAPSRQRDNNLYESVDRWRWEVATAGPYPPSTVEQVEDVPDLFSEMVR